MCANWDSLERVGRADEQINKMLTEYLENKDEEASEVTQTAKWLRTETSATATGSFDPLPQQEIEGDMEIGNLEASAESSKRSLDEPQAEERHARRQKLALLETEGRGQVNGRSIEGRKCLKDLLCLLGCAGAGERDAEVQENSSLRAWRGGNAGSQRQICQDESGSMGQG